MATKRDIDTINLLTTTTGTLELVELDLSSGIRWLLPRELLLETEGFKQPPADLPAADLVHHFNAEEQAGQWVVLLGDEAHWALGVNRVVIPGKQRISDLPDLEDQGDRFNRQKYFVYQWVQYQAGRAIVPDLEALERALPAMANATEASQSTLED